MNISRSRIIQDRELLINITSHLLLIVSSGLPKKKNYSGSPLPIFLDYSSGLPNGWKVKTFSTKKSNHGDRLDRLWYTKSKKVLRSRIEVQMYLHVLEINDGNEEQAWKLFHLFRKNANLWQKTRKFVCAQAKSLDDGDGKEIIDHTDVEEIKNKLLRIKEILNEK